MNSEPRETSEAELAGLADGSLRAGARERDELLAHVQASPELARSLATQERVRALMGSEEVRAPARLQRSVRELADRHGRSRPPARGRLAVGGAIGALAATAVVALVLALGSTTTAAPSVIQAARLGLLPATTSSPRESSDQSGRLDVSVQGVAFPYLERGPGWRAQGARSDTFAGRRVTTVFYVRGANSAQRVGYSILARPALAVPGGGRTVVRDGTSYTLLRAGDSQVVTWRRTGHTCVLVGSSGVDGSTLLALASRRV